MTSGEALSLPGLGPYLSILVAAALPTHVWRWMGVLLAERLPNDSEVFIWIKAVTTALVAGLVSQLILFPHGALADVSIPVRIVAAGVGVGVYLATKRTLALGILSAEAILIGAWFVV
ncbi:AzlD domain-containing protein [Amorphus sp. MBR-141]